MKYMYLLLCVAIIRINASAPIWEKEFGVKSNLNVIPPRTNASEAPIWIYDLEYLKTGVSKYYAVQLDSITINIYKIESGELEITLKIPISRQDFQFVSPNSVMNTYAKMGSVSYGAGAVIIKGFTNIGNGWASIIMTKHPQGAYKGAIIVSDPTGAEILKTDTSFTASLFYTGSTSYLLVETVSVPNPSTKVYKLAEGIANNNLIIHNKKYYAKQTSFKKEVYATNGRISKQYVKVLKTYLK